MKAFYFFLISSRNGALFSLKLPVTTRDVVAFGLPSRPFGFLHINSNVTSYNMFTVHRL